ncbi:SRPBCC family protein [Streptomyces tendae]
MHGNQERNPDIHWPSGLTPADAHSFHRSEAVVPVPPQRALSVLTDLGSWVDWVPGCESVSADTFTSAFEVRGAGRRFEVFVGEYEPPNRLGWLWIGAGVRLYQAWLLTEVADGTRIVVESAVRGSAPKALDTLSPSWMQILDELWQAQLARIRTETSGVPEGPRAAGAVGLSRRSPGAGPPASLWLP